MAEEGSWLTAFSSLTHRKGREKQARLKPFPVAYFLLAKILLPKVIYITSLNTTRIGDRVHIHKPMGDITYSNHHSC